MSAGRKLLPALIVDIVYAKPLLRLLADANTDWLAGVNHFGLCVVMGDLV